MTASPQVELSQNGAAKPERRETAGPTLSLHPAGSSVGYARVSTVDQHIDAQVDALKAAGCHRIFIEHGVSGTKTARPQLTACLDYIRPGDTLVVWKLDRLGRSLPHLIEVVTSLRERGIGFRSLTEGLDTSGALGELLFHIFGAFAQFERSLIIERTQAGLAAARARGRVGGRPVKCTDETVEAARVLIAGGLTVTAAAKQLGVHRATLHRHLG